MNDDEKRLNKINQFRDDRNWRQFHNEKDLAISISLEASELLELFQWKSSSEVKENKLDRVREELADVLIYAYMMADNLDLDIDNIINEKLKQNEEKYPISKAKNKNDKYT
ncbi:MAG: nucleotide pyrophosphohydrolase, partial [Tetragenococcus halophilus]|nr:nucleotide pyrophosphohydrolase [Tetragenococcus halophilus]